MKNYIIDLLLEKLEDYKDIKVYGCDLAYKLLEVYNIDGSITYSTYKAKEWLKDNFEELGDFLEEYQANFGYEALSNLTLDIFNNPEKAMTIIVLEKASEIIGQLEFIKNSWENEITLNDDTIKIIKEQLEDEVLK